MAQAQIKRIGYGQVELNFVSAGRIGGVYASRPYEGNAEILEQGMFLKYDPATNTCNTTGKGEWYMVYNEEEHYDEREMNHKDYAMKKSDFIDDKMYPRLLKISTGDIFTTNTFGKYNPSYDYAKAKATYPGNYYDDVKNANTTLTNTTLNMAKVTTVIGVKGGSEGIALERGDEVMVGKTDGYLVKSDNAEADADGPVFVVSKVYCMADGQPAVKLQRIK